MARNTILVIGDGIQSEAIADAAINPGMLVELLDTGKVQKQATTSVDCERAFAIEDALQGHGIADAYAAGDVVFCRVFSRGDEVLAVLADGQNVAIGDDIESAGGGEVKKYSAGVKIGVAREALNLSATGFAIAARRIVIRIQ